MPDQEFNSLEDYEGFILAQIGPWSPARRVVLAAAMAERWLPAYETFSASEDWGDPALLRQSLDMIWDTATGRTSSTVDWSRLSSRIHNITPHLDDFDAHEALCACVIVQYAITCCAKEDNQSPASMAVLSGLEAVRPDLLTVDRVPSRFWKQVALHRELNKQLRLIDHISALTDLKNASEALRPFLTDPAMMGEVRPRKAPKTPPTLTNQVAFEMYKRMVQADIRGAANNLDPRQNPELATVLYLADWMGRYHRRQELISGGYGALADRVALDLLVAKNRARDRAEPDLPAWEPEARWIIDTTYHNTHNGLDAGAVEEPHGYGPSLRRLWVEAKRRGLSDADAWESIKAWAYHQPQAWSTKGKGGKSKLAAARAALQGHLGRPLIWSATGDLSVPWATEVDGESWQVRLNDFPDEFMYSLLIGGEVMGDFHDWPKTWKRE
jgi:hypothetical protein